MALTTASARARVKDYADIPTATTTFDADIDEYVISAVDNLYPIAMNEIAPDTSKTFSLNARDVTLPSGVDQVRRLELYDSSLSDYSETHDYMVHAGKIWLDNPVTESTVARIWGWGRYTLTTVPAELYLVVFYDALSQLYASLGGNRRKYNIYISASGSAADRDMKDSADYWKSQSDALLRDRAKLAGG